MKRKIKTHRRSHDAASLADPKFRQRVVRSRRNYLRNQETEKELDDELRNYNDIDYD